MEQIAYPRLGEISAGARPSGTSAMIGLVLASGMWPPDVKHYPK
jgi:hypothetical protein